MTDSPESFDQVAERYRPELLAYLTRMLGDPHDAEDACQDALLRAHRAFGRLLVGSNTRAWLYKIATNTALNALKRRRRQEAHQVDIDLERIPDSANASLEQREQLRAVARAVEDLPPKQRAALMMRRFQGLDYAEIAAALGGSEEAARANVYQAIRQLRRMLNVVT
jgi:RNA polymerase sigma-70 factor (ECF subfamily)